MLRATELVFGLEKIWRHKHRDARNMPYHAGLIPLMHGIAAGDAYGHIGQSIHWILWGVLLALAAGLGLYGRLRAKACHFAARRYMWLFQWFLFCFTLGLVQGMPTSQTIMPENQFCSIEGKIETLQPGSSQAAVRIHHWKCGDLSQSGDMRARISLHDENYEWARGMAFITRAKFERYPSPDVPGMFDARRWARAENIAGRLIRERSKDHEDYPMTRTDDSPASLTSRLELARRRAFDIMAEKSPQGIAPALVLGASRDISPQTRNDFGRVGIAHVLAVSGLHFGIIAIVIRTIFNIIFGFCPWIMRRFGRQRASMIAMLPVLAIYLAFVGTPISAQRALFMLMVCSIGRFIGRKGDRMRALAFAGFIILTADPMALFSISFQLSFSAVLGIVWCMDFYERECRDRIRELEISPRMLKAMDAMTSMLLMSIATALTTAPFVMYHFGQLPVMGIIANLIVIPFVSFILMPLAIITALLLIFGLPGASHIADFCGLLETLFARAASWYNEEIPLTCLDIPPHIAISVLAAAAAVGILCRMSFKPKRIVIAAVSAVLLIACFIAFQVNPRLLTMPDGLRITFVSMGQADATLIEFDNGHVMAVDAGSELGNTRNAGQTRLVPLLKTLGIRKIDTLVLTHGDYDHAAGVSALLESCHIGEIWHNGQTDMDWHKTAESLNIPTTDVGTQIPVRHFGHADVGILWPRHGEISGAVYQGNESSVVLDIRQGAFSAVLMGDAGIEAEHAMLTYESRPIRSATVLKVGHHGSKSATSPDWIKRIQPRYAVFSVGAHNKYRLPNIDVESRLFLADAQIYRTDRDGSIRMTTDGVRLRVETMY